MDYAKLRDLLLQAPNNELDSVAKVWISKWGDKPDPASILYVLDMCVNGSLCTDFCITVMDAMLKEVIREENTTMEEVVKNAHWRNDLTKSV